MRTKILKVADKNDVTLVRFVKPSRLAKPERRGGRRRESAFWLVSLREKLIHDLLDEFFGEFTFTKLRTVRLAVQEELARKGAEGGSSPSQEEAPPATGGAPQQSQSDYVTEGY